MAGGRLSDSAAERPDSIDYDAALTAAGYLCWRR